MLTTKPLSLDFMTQPNEFRFGARCSALLHEPFPIRGDDGREILKKKILIEKNDGTAAQISYYIDPRDLHSRLTSVVGSMNWLVSQPRFYFSNDTIFCVAGIWIAGITNWATGEEALNYGRGDNAKVNDNAGTSAEAQAVKRAAVPFGVGAYLYRLHEINTWSNEVKKSGRYMRMNHPKVDLKNDTLDKSLPAWMFPMNGAKLVMRELGILLGISIPEDPKDLDEADAKTLKKTLKEMFGIETLTSSSGLGYGDYFRLAACIARTTDHCNSEQTNIHNILAGLKK